MNKIVFVLLIALSAAFSVKAQIRKSSLPDTNINAATSYVSFNSIASKVNSFQATVKKISGTVAGKVYLQGTIDGLAFINIDSLVLTDQSINSKVFPVTSTIYNSYRGQFTTTGTQSSYLILTVLRRPDE